MEANKLPGIVEVIFQQCDNCDQNCDCEDCVTEYDSDDGPTDCK
jgi:hypothetical protein